MPIPCCVDPDPPDPVPECVTTQGASPDYRIDTGAPTAMHVLVVLIQYQSTFQESVFNGTYLMAPSGDTDNWVQKDTDNPGAVITSLVGKSSGDPYVRAVDSLEISGFGLRMTIDQVSVGLSWRTCLFGGNGVDTPHALAPNFTTWITPRVFNLDVTSALIAGHTGLSDTNPVLECCACAMNPASCDFLYAGNQVGTHVWGGSNGRCLDNSGIPCLSVFWRYVGDGLDECGSCQSPTALLQCGQSTCDVQRAAIFYSADPLDARDSAQFVFGDQMVYVRTNGSVNSTLISSLRYADMTDGGWNPIAGGPWTEGQPINPSNCGGTATHSLSPL